MTSEDQELLARISELAGHINRHKNQQAGITSIPSSPYNNPYSSSPASYSRPGYSSRGRGGYRVKKPGPYRNRTLVLNNSGSSSRSDPTENGDSTSTTNDNAGSSSSTTWVARTDRHRQLINADVYEKDAQARARAIEKTRSQTQKMRNDRERAKLQSHFAYLAGGRQSQTYQVMVEGIPFAVTKNGSKLVKLPGASARPSVSSPPPSSPDSVVDFYEDSAYPCAHLSPGDPTPASSTPKTAVVGGVKFYRSKNGNLYRHGIVKAQQQRKVAACKDFLLKGDCPNGSDCDLSHDLTAERTPFCLHYAKGNCTNPHCSYTHSQVSSGAPVCRAFGFYGYCDNGADCTERHVFECPDFSNTGVCKIKGCKLPHRERASFMRRNDKPKENDDDNNDDYSDMSSDDESVNSDDVDSDEVDEFVGADGDDADLDFVNQKDYIEI